jgi:hypothetical protein
MSFVEHNEHFGRASFLGRTVRAIDCTGTSSAENVISALEWVAANRVLPAIASLSLGSAFSNQLLDAALQVKPFAFRLGPSSLNTYLAFLFVVPFIRHIADSFEINSDVSHLACAFDM